MIKPSEINPSVVLIDPSHVAEIESAFDVAIRRAHNSGLWPAAVADQRDGVSKLEVEHVADKYRTEGWKVVTGGRTERALIDHPDRKRP